MVAGCSATPLARRLGIKEGHAVALLNAPDGFEATLAGLPDGVTLRRSARGRADGVVSFPVRRSHLERRLPVDNKVCAIDDTWSGLRVVWRREVRDSKR